MVADNVSVPVDRHASYDHGAFGAPSPTMAPLRANSLDDIPRHCNLAVRTQTTASSSPRVCSFSMPPTKGLLLVHAETAFDCATTGIKLATYDLLNTAPCPEYKSLYRKKVMHKAQFLQRDASKLVDAVQCQLHVSRELCYCGTVWSSKYDLRSPSLPFLSK